MVQVEFVIQALVNGLAIGGLYALIAVGLTIIFGIMDIVNFAHGEFFMVGAYVGFVASDWVGLNFYLGIPFAMVVVALIAVAIERVVFRPLREREVLDKLLASIGVLFVLQTAAILVFGNTPRSFDSPYANDVIEVGGIFIPTIRLFLLVSTIVLFVLLWLFLQRTKIGKAMRATALNEEAAEIRGVNIEHVHMTTFAIGGALAGAAGAIVGTIYSIHPAMGLLPVLKAFSVVIVGGLGSVPGALLGGFLIGPVESFGATFGPTEYRHAYAFLALILVLLVRPQGILRGWER